MSAFETPDARLSALGIVLPEPARPVANYVPFCCHSGLVTVSGQLPLENGKPAFLGVVGDSITVDDAVQAARLCAVNLLAQVKAACEGDLGRVRAVVRLGGFVNAVTAFTDHPTVVNGASDLMVAVFADAGRHARSAVGVASLPLGVPVEIEAQFLIDQP